MNKRIVLKSDRDAEYRNKAEDDPEEYVWSDHALTVKLLKNLGLSLFFGFLAIPVFIKGVAPMTFYWSSQFK